jgi:hypothetical protein
MEEPSPVLFTAARMVGAEGARVGLITCLLCGATILLDPDDSISALQLHTEWHSEPELEP